MSYFRCGLRKVKYPRKKEDRCSLPEGERQDISNKETSYTGMYPSNQIESPKKRTLTRHQNRREQSTEIDRNAFSIA